MCNVISKAARRNDVCRQVMDRQAIGWSCKTTCRIVGLQVNDEGCCCASDICQGRFIYDCRCCSCVCTDAKQTCGECGIDQTHNAPALECVLFENCIGNSKAQAARIVGWTVI